MIHSEKEAQSNDAFKSTRCSRLVWLNEINKLLLRQHNHITTISQSKNVIVKLSVLKRRNTNIYFISSFTKVPKYKVYFSP